MRAAAAYCREGRGPALVHAHCVRPYSHSLSDDERHYKTAARARRRGAARSAGQFPRSFLLEEGLIERARAGSDGARDPPRDLSRIEDRAARPSRPRLKRRCCICIRKPSTRLRPRSTIRPQPSGEPKTMADLINATLKEEMRRNDRMVVFGEDVADCSREGNLSEVKGKGGVFKLTAGLQSEFGSAALLQFAHRRGLHRGPRQSAWRWRAEARGRDPVLRLHLARDDADSR